MSKQNLNIHIYPSLITDASMNHKKLIFLSSLAFSILFCVSSVSAESDIDISAIPQGLADKMGIPLFATQLLCSGILLLIFVMPVALIGRKKSGSPIAELFVGFLILGVCIALGWLPVWLFLMLCLLVGLMFAGKMRDFLSGGGKD